MSLVNKKQEVWTLAEVRDGKIHPVSHELLAWGRTLADARGTLLASLVLGDESLAYTLVLVEMTAARHSARQEEHIGILETLDVLKLEVSLDGDAVGSLYPFSSGDAYSLDIHATSAQDVNRSQSFDFLEAVGKKFIYLSHNFIFFIA